MDSTEIATQTIAILTPFLTQVANSDARETNREAWAKAVAIQQSVRSRIERENDDYLSQTLARYEKDPGKRKAAMSELLEELLDEDEAFTLSLAALLKEADEAGAGAVFNVIVSGGQVGEIVNVDTVEGNLIIGKTSTSKEAGGQEKAGDDDDVAARRYPLLRRNLIRYFNEGELQDLAFDLSLDHELLSGDNKRDLARELIAYCERRGRIPDLVAACRVRRPNVEQWLEEDDSLTS